MTPFQELRFWLHRAPAGERTAAGIAAVLALAVLTWVAIPAGSATGPLPAAELGAAPGASAGTGTGTASGTGSGARGAGTSVAAAGPTGPSGTAAGAVGAPGTAAGASGANGTVNSRSGTGTRADGSGTGTLSRSCPAGNAPGVSASRLKIAIVLTNIVGPAANSLFGIATTEKQQQWFDAAIQDTNARGGAGCRKIVAQYFKANPTDQNNLQQICLETQSAGVFAVLDSGAYANFPIVQCFAQAGIPYFGAYFISETQRTKFYPLMFEFNSADQLYSDTVLALKSRGFYDAGKGFKKLGFLYRSCDKVMVSNMKKLLSQVAGPDVVGYDFGCPNALASPSDIQQAVLSFQRAGVTHVNYAAFVADFASFTKTAQQQGFKPKYGLPDDALVTLTYGTQAADYNNIADAVAISAARSGEERTPGIKPNAASLQCNAAFKKYGDLGDVYKLPQGAGNSCGLIGLFDAAVDHAPALQRTALAAGLQAAKSVDLSFPLAPNDFTARGTTTGGQFWRPVQFHTSCSCWQVLDPAFKRTFW